MAPARAFYDAADRSTVHHAANRVAEPPARLRQNAALVGTPRRSRIVRLPRRDLARPAHGCGATRRSCSMGQMPSSTASRTATSWPAGTPGSSITGVSRAPIGDWPLLQHVPDLVSIALGADSHDTRELVFVVLSAAGLVGAAAAARVALRLAGQPAWFWGFLVAASGVPAPRVRALDSRRGPQRPGCSSSSSRWRCVQAPPPLIAAAALAACLTKETSYPFVVVLGLTGLLLARSRTGRPIRRHLVWGAGGVAAGALAASLFNVARFGSVLNTNYLERELHTPGVLRPLEYALALFVSPNGGMAVYWPAACARAACRVSSFRSSSRSGMRLPQWPALVLVGLTVALTLGFAAWWDPFGAGYGPRLTLPWVLPLVLLALVAYGSLLGPLTARLLAPTWRPARRLPGRLHARAPARRAPLEPRGHGQLLRGGDDAVRRALAWRSRGVARVPVEASLVRPPPHAGPLRRGGRHDRRCHDERRARARPARRAARPSPGLGGASAGTLGFVGGG